MAASNPRPTRRDLERLDAIAERLSVHPRTLRRRISDGTLTGYRIANGRTLFLDRDEVDRKLVRTIPVARRST
jgi:excisionase family DNA binding protein